MFAKEMLWLLMRCSLWRLRQGRKPRSLRLATVRRQLVWQAREALGRLSVAPARAVFGAGKDGTVVPSVDPTTLAAERGFREGDVVLEAGGKALPIQLMFGRLSTAPKLEKSSILARVRRDGFSRFVAVPAGDG